MISNIQNWRVGLLRQASSFDKRDKQVGVRGSAVETRI